MIQNSINPPSSNCKATPLRCSTCLKRRLSLLCHLTPSELLILEKNRYEVRFKTGETIYSAGTKPRGLLCLNEGKVKISRLGINGTEQIVSFKKPVDFIGFRALMGEYNYLNSAVALEDTTICHIDKIDFFEVVKNNSDLIFKIFRLFAKDLELTDSRMLSLTQKHLRARLADGLLMIDEAYGSSSKNGELNLSLKRADLAACSNMTTANAIRVLSSFAKEKIIEINQRKILIKNFSKLKEISLFEK